MKDFFIPFKGVFCRVEPLVFDGTLSFLECLAKLQDYVNKLNANITAINTLIEAIETELEGKQDTLTFDTTPTDGSNNPVTSNGIFDALEGKQDTLTFDTEPTNGSTNPVTSDGIFDALAGKQNTLTFDTTPTNGSTNPVTSDGIFDALEGKQDNLTFDDVPTDGSANPVTSNGVYAANVGLVGYVNSIKDTLETAITNTRYDVNITDFDNPSLPAGVTYTSINNANIAGKIVRVKFASNGLIGYYVGNGMFLGWDDYTTSIITVSVTTQNTVRTHSYPISSAT